MIEVLMPTFMTAKHRQQLIEENIMQSRVTKLMQMLASLKQTSDLLGTPAEGRTVKLGIKQWKAVYEKHMTTRLNKDSKPRLVGFDIEWFDDSNVLDDVIQAIEHARNEMFRKCRDAPMTLLMKPKAYNALRINLDLLHGINPSRTPGPHYDFNGDTRSLNGCDIVVSNDVRGDFQIVISVHAL